MSNSMTDTPASSSVVQSTSSLIRALSHSEESKRIAACRTLIERLKTGEVTVAQLIQMEAVTPLLKVIQDDSDHVSSVVSTSTAPSSSLSSHSLSHSARDLLDQLQLESRRRLNEIGWTVSVDSDTGILSYHHIQSGRSQPVPPSLNENNAETASSTTSAVTSSSHSTEPEWVSCLLAELPMLCQPRINPNDGSRIWLAHVREHQPATDTCDSLSVIDVRPEIENGVATTTSSSDDVSSPFVEGTSRQLVLGVWQGVGCAFRETEADLSYAPGEHLENWYTVTLAAMALLLDAHARRDASSHVESSGPSTSSSSLPSSPSPRVLVVGLGGGSLVSFLTLYAPRLTVECVELNAKVVDVATRWFGVQRANDEKSNSANSPLHPTHTAPDFASPPSGKPIHIHVGDAADFLLNAPNSSYDLILLDVYTSGIFPPSLLTSEFFNSLRRVLGPNGSVAINAGIGSDRERVLELTVEAFGMDATRLLIDRKEVTRAQPATTSTTSDTTTNPNVVAFSSSDTAENAVVCAGGLTRDIRHRLNVVDWRKSVVGIRQVSSIAYEDTASKSVVNDFDRPIPFQLASARTDDTTLPHSLHLAWSSSELDKLTERSNRESQRLEKAKTVKLASKEDAAWALFD